MDTHPKPVRNPNIPRTLSKEYGRYTNEFKRLSVLLTHYPDILAVDIAKQLGIHPVMLYRWRMEMKNGEIPGNVSLGEVETETDLIKANQRIKALEKDLACRQVVSTTGKSANAEKLKN